MSIRNGWSPRNLPHPGGFERIGSERRYGVELEYFDVNRYESLQGRTIFGAKEDGSVDGEFYSPILQGDNGLSECENFCDLARDAGFQPNSGAGYHAHFDLSTENPHCLQSIVLAYHLTYSFWKLTVPDHRVTSHWSGQHDYTAADAKVIRSKASMQRFAQRDRYEWANFSAYNKFGTVELRIHEATHSAADVVNWIMAHTRFIDAVAGLSSDQLEKIFDRKSGTQIVREMRCVIREPRVMSHLLARMGRFHPGCRRQRQTA